MIASNSLAYLLNEMNDKLESDNTSYLAVHQKVNEGLDHAIAELRTSSGRLVNLVYYDHMKVDADLNITFERPHFIEDFTDYTTYTDYVQGVLGRVLENADNSRREFRYTPIGTISSGYDSPTIAVWAKSMGCREAVTFPQSRRSKSGGEE